MAILRPDSTSTLGGVTVKEYLLTKHNPNRIDMPSASMAGKIIGVTKQLHPFIPIREESMNC